jgi:hypothetical protein
LFEENTKGERIREGGGEERENERSGEKERRETY